jgi:hypothetical protein
VLVRTNDWNAVSHVFPFEPLCADFDRFRQVDDVGHQSGEGILEKTTLSNEIHMEMRTVPSIVSAAASCLLEIFTQHRVQKKV